MNRNRIELNMYEENLVYDREGISNKVVYSVNGVGTIW